MAHELQSFSGSLRLLYCFLNALLVVLEEVGPRGLGALPVQELRGKPATEAFALGALPGATSRTRFLAAAPSDGVTLRRFALREDALRTTEAKKE